MNEGFTLHTYVTVSRIKGRQWKASNSRVHSSRIIAAAATYLGRFTQTVPYQLQIDVHVCILVCRMLDSDQYPAVWIFRKFADTLFMQDQQPPIICVTNLACGYTSLVFSLMETDKCSQFIYSFSRVSRVPAVISVIIFPAELR